MSEFNFDDIWNTSGAKTLNIYDLDDMMEVDPVTHKAKVQEIGRAHTYDSGVDQTRQILNLLLVIDTSGSMRGNRIGQVNFALENVFKELRSQTNTNAQFKVGILEFNDGAQWVTPQPVPLDDFVFTRIEASPYLTQYGDAFKLLEEKLHRSEFMDPSKGEYFAPVIMFLTDGEPTDEMEYPVQLRKLQKNGWFRQSARYAIAVGEEARTAKVQQILTEFTENELNVRYADEGAALVQLIEFVAVRASMVQSTMVSTGPDRSESNSVFTQRDSSLFSSLVR